MSATQAARYLNSAAAVRARCHQVLEYIRQGHSTRWRLEPGRLDLVAGRVADHIRARYPSLQIPYHGRLNHLRVAREGDAGWIEALGDDLATRSVALADLIIVSVLLDAGAGPDWSYVEEATGREWSRSEGLAVASLEMFLGGAFGASGAEGPHAGAARLAQLEAPALAHRMQVDAQDNPLVGLEARAELLRQLGRAVQARPEVFPDGRPGQIVGWLLEPGRPLQADALLEAILELFGSIWPGRHALAGVALGDTWSHPAAREHPDGPDDPSDGWVPLHKLSQWLAYSLAGMMRELGYEVAGFDELTGLAEYRNGGLLVDLGALALRDPADAGRVHATGAELIIEWRAATVALLDELRPEVAERLDLAPEQLRMPQLLEGGTWSAGRAEARQRRASGAPPLQIARDGTAF